MYPRDLVWCIFTLAVSLPQAATAQPLRVAYVDVAPYAYQDKQQQAKGMLIERIQEIADAISQPVTFLYLPHRRLISHIERGDVDMWAGQKDSKVSGDTILVSQSPLFVMDLKAFWRKPSRPVDAFSDLHGRNLIMISSYSYGGNYRSLTERSHAVSYVINHDQGFRQLFEQPDYYLLGYRKISQQVIEKYAIKDIFDSTLATYTLHLKLSRHYPAAEQIMSEIDAYLSQQ